jgi:hypoxia-inducible factor (prolyl hydroxylase)
MMRCRALREDAARAVGADPDSFALSPLPGFALDAVAAELTSSNFCVLDELLGPVTCAALRREVVGARAAGALVPSKVGGGRVESELQRVEAAARGDHVGWFTGAEQDLWPSGSLGSFLERIDALVVQLGERIEALAGVAARSKAMVTCYPGGGARYVKHVDNACSAGEGEHCNGRRLTAILYLNEGWRPDDGGELRLHAPYASAEMPPLADVPPTADRLVLFWSDARVPHEVLPSRTDRFAITAWYFDEAEHTRARARQPSGSVEPEGVRLRAMEQPTET